ncbi:Hypothetical_protein [Hexamita inflata]|uniref:Hypothetical_protein n=1 Tax=Hexamita inflata TaxID=28002 RepID=A0AA86UUK7_9EUKA|nr:Hypothetical protein HINF_LOCUS52846 [Hexamita inflata]
MFGISLMYAGMCSKQYLRYHQKLPISKIQYLLMQNLNVSTKESMKTTVQNQSLQAVENPKDISKHVFLCAVGLNYVQTNRKQPKKRHNRDDKTDSDFVMSLFKQQGVRPFDTHDNLCFELQTVQIYKIIQT